MKLLIGLLLLSGTLSAQIQTCPAARFSGPDFALPECNADGIVTIDVQLCGGEGFTVDHTDWIFGDGISTTTNGLSVTHSYSPEEANNYFNVHAVTYLQAGSQQCEVEVQFSNFTSPCEAAPVQNTLKVRVIRLDPVLYPSSPVVEQGSPLTFYWTEPHDYHGETAKLYIDGVLRSTTAVSNSMSLPATAGTYSDILPGQHTAELILSSNKDCEVSTSCIFEVLPEAGCEYCFTFRPVPGQRYWLSAWVKEGSAQSLNYTMSEINLRIQGVSTAFATLVPSGDVIEGWQRIAGEFTVPAGISVLDIELKNKYASGTTDVFFDDIRIHPYNASMKAYVYDPATLWLVAELDDNNFATYYEYDREGQLIRVKKETELGIVTLKESRSSNSKH